MLFEHCEVVDTIQYFIEVSHTESIDTDSNLPKCSRETCQVLDGLLSKPDSSNDLLMLSLDFRLVGLNLIFLLLQHLLESRSLSILHDELFLELFVLVQNLLVLVVLLQQQFLLMCQDSRQLRLLLAV